jgi:signal peptidase I
MGLGHWGTARARRGVLLAASTMSFGLLVSAGAASADEQYVKASREMAPTIVAGSTLVVDPLAYRHAQPLVGHIVTYHPPHSRTCARPETGAPCAMSESAQAEEASKQKARKAAEAQSEYAEEALEAREEKAEQEVAVGRVVAGPGDRVGIAHGRVIRNGRVEEAAPLASTCRPSSLCALPRTIVVPPREYFLVADNRASTDSRAWGPIRLGLITGRVVKTLRPGVSPFTPIRGGDIVVAIVGGVLLIMVMTRPRVKWPPIVGDRYEWIPEVGLSISAFFVGGFALDVLVAVLRYDSIDAVAKKALVIAAVVITAYGLLVHHEPYIEEGELRLKSYLLSAAGAAVAGAVFGEFVTGNLPFWRFAALLAIALACAIGGALNVAHDYASGRASGDDPPVDPASNEDESWGG